MAIAALRVWRDGMRPDLRPRMSESTHSHPWRTSTAASEPGWFAQRARHLRKVRDALFPLSGAAHLVHEGSTGWRDLDWQQLGRLCRPYASGSMLAVLSTVALATRTTRGRLDPEIIESRRCLSG